MSPVLEPYTDLGCWKDTGDRSIPTLEGLDPILDGDYWTRTDPINKCAEVARKNGYRVFAVQAGGWCAATGDAENTYSKYGRSTNCQQDGEGGSLANQVYEQKIEGMSTSETPHMNSIPLKGR